MTKRNLTLIALVATALMVDGERVVVQAGQPLPEPIKEKDRAEMLATRVAAEGAADADPAEPVAVKPVAPEKPSTPDKPAAADPPSKSKKR